MKRSLLFTGLIWGASFGVFATFVLPFLVYAGMFGNWVEGSVLLTFVGRVMHPLTKSSDLSSLGGTFIVNLLFYGAIGGIIGLAIKKFAVKTNQKKPK